MKKEKCNEKFVIYTDEKVEKIKKMTEGRSVMWFHVTSVGEFNAIKVLLKKFNEANRLILVTTVTTSGVLICRQYQENNPNIMHAHIPFDTPQAINKFLKIWKPECLFLVESEIWINLITIVSKTCLIGIINARMSYKSFKRWRRFSFVLRKILSNCKFIAASSESSLKHYSTFYDNVLFTGNIKYDAEPLYADPVELEKLQSKIGNRKVLVCASTHPNEEEILLHVYKRISEKIKDFLLIIAPRHIERGDEIKKICEKNNLNCILKSENDTDVNDNTQIYIVDKLGELGTLFKLCKISFIGGSFVEKVGGHNVLEPARLGNIVIIGPNYQNFLEIVDSMKDRDLIIMVRDGLELSRKFIQLINDNERISKTSQDTKEYVKSYSGALEKTINIIEHNVFL